jgi:hypothetical protein
MVIDGGGWMPNRIRRSLDQESYLVVVTRVLL